MVTGLAIPTLAMAWLAVSGGLLLWSSAPILWGWQPRLVLSGSMEPGLHPGDVVLTAPVTSPQSIGVGQVIAVTDPSLPAGNYLHRVVRRDPDGRLVTRGDANRSDDFPPASSGRVLGQARLMVPAIGRPVLWSRQGNPVPLIAVILVTLAAVVVTSWDRDPAGSADVGAPLRRRAAPGVPVARRSPAGRGGPILGDPALSTAEGRDGDRLRSARRASVHRSPARVREVAVSLGVVAATAVIVGTGTWAMPVTAAPDAQLFTLDRFLPVAVTVVPVPVPVPAAACRVSWSPAAGAPLELTYDIEDRSGHRLATAVPATADAAVVSRLTGRAFVRVRFGTWTSTTRTASTSTCSDPGRL